MCIICPLLHRNLKSITVRRHSCIFTQFALVVPDRGPSLHCMSAESLKSNATPRSRGPNIALGNIVRVSILRALECGAKLVGAVDFWALACDLWTGMKTNRGCAIWGWKTSPSGGFLVSPVRFSAAPDKCPLDVWNNLNIRTRTLALDKQIACRSF